MYKITLGERLGFCLKVWKEDRRSSIKNEKTKLGNLVISWGMEYLYHECTILIRITRFTVLLYCVQPDYEVHSLVATGS